VRVPDRAKRLARILALTLLLPSLCPSASTAAEEEIDRLLGGESPTAVSQAVTSRLEYFTWREYDGKELLLYEAGPRLQAGYQRRYNRDDILFTPRVSVTGGYVSYDGKTQPPESYPVGTRVRYVGAGIGADVGVLYHLMSQTQLEPYLGLGFDYWRRDIRSSSTMGTIPVSGYLETWDTVYARGGARGEADLKAGSSSFKGYGELGIKIPLSTQNSVKFPGAGRTNVNPKGDFSPYVGAGVILDRLKVGLFYDTWRFQSSDPVVAGIDNTGRALVLEQPKSRAEIFGIELGYAF
jgi:hypothetical protein